MPRLQVHRLLKCVTGAGLALAIVAAVPEVCGAQSVAPSTLKAAFTLNFVKFTTWPDLKPTMPILVCVLGDDTVALAMTQVMTGQTVDGHAVRVARLAPNHTTRDCNLLFLTDRDPQRLAASLEAVSRLQILTVSDVEQSSRRGAIIEFNLQNNRLGFVINVDAMERSRIKISSRLLLLAAIVRDTDTP
ncbi:MAG TPA: YfiR family protein [Vicinamibacterales bacterium]|nr:YfiR family protein [Vicinamibacterales bacterium]